MVTREQLIEEHNAIRTQLDAIDARINAPMAEVGESLEISQRLSSLLALFRDVHAPQERALFNTLTDADIERDPGLLVILAESEWIEAELVGLLEDTRSHAPGEWDELYTRLVSFTFGLRELIRQEEEALFPVALRPPAASQR